MRAVPASVPSVFHNSLYPEVVAAKYNSLLKAVKPRGEAAADTAEDVFRLNFTPLTLVTFGISRPNPISIVTIRELHFVSAVRGGDVHLIDKSSTDQLSCLKDRVG